MFGRDSMGGALRIWTKRPADDFGGNVTITAGSLDRLDAKGSIDLPFGDKVKTKWTAANLSRGGYITSLTTGESGRCESTSRSIAATSSGRRPTS